MDSIDYWGNELPKCPTVEPISRSGLMTVPCRSTTKMTGTRRSIVQTAGKSSFASPASGMSSRRPCLKKPPAMESGVHGRTNLKDSPTHSLPQGTR